MNKKKQMKNYILYLHILWNYCQINNNGLLELCIKMKTVTWSWILKEWEPFIFASLIQNKYIWLKNDIFYRHKQSVRMTFYRVFSLSVGVAGTIDLTYFYSSRFRRLPTFSSNHIKNGKYNHSCHRCILYRSRVKLPEIKKKLKLVNIQVSSYT